MTNKRVADRIEGPIDYSGPESQFTVRTPEGPGSYGKRAPVQIDRRSPQLRNPETPGFVKKDNSSIVEGVVSQGGELIVTGGSEVRSVDQSGRPSVKGVIIGRGKVQVSGGARVLGRSVYLSGDVVIKGPKALVKDSPPAGTDGSEARKKYNQWYQENVCEARPDNCGRPEPKKRR